MTKAGLVLILHLIGLLLKYCALSSPITEISESNLMQSHIIIETQWKICFHILAVVAIITFFLKIMCLIFSVNLKVKDRYKSWLSQLSGKSRFKRLSTVNILSDGSTLLSNDSSSGLIPSEPFSSDVLKERWRLTDQTAACGKR